MPLISVILTTYNRADLLEKCVNSVLRQTYSHYEIVILDDCSTDETPTIIRRLCARDRRIKAVRNNVNLGNACSRNTAVKKSRGEYLAFLDDDDYWLDENKLIVQVKSLQGAAAKVGICCTKVRLVQGSGGSTVLPLEFPRKSIEWILRGNGIIFNSTVMIRRSLFDSIGGFDERMGRGVDSEFFRNALCRYGCEVLFLSEVTTFVNTNLAVRMTVKRGTREACRLVFAHTYLLWKYRWQYLLHPLSLLARVSLLVRTPLKALFN